MDISIQFVFVQATNTIPDERFRKLRGHVVALYDSADLCVPDGEFLTVKEPLNTQGRLAFIHVRGYPIDSIDPLLEFLTEAVEENGEPIRNRSWLIDVDSMQPGTIAILEAKREVTADWSDQNAAILKRLNIPDTSDASLDSLGDPATMADLPSNG